MLFYIVVSLLLLTIFWVIIFDIYYAEVLANPDPANENDLHNQSFQEIAKYDFTNSSQRGLTGLNTITGSNEKSQRT